jgi:hypothetical protein
VEKFTCFRCDKELTNCGPPQKDHYCTHIDDGGWANLHFGYGSRYDNIECDGSLQGTTDMVIFICDDCFAEKFKNVECWNLKGTESGSLAGKKLEIESPENRGEMRFYNMPNLQDLIDLL